MNIYKSLGRVGGGMKKTQKCEWSWQQRQPTFQCATFVKRNGNNHIIKIQSSFFFFQIVFWLMCCLIERAEHANTLSLMLQYIKLFPSEITPWHGEKTINTATQRLRNKVWPNQLASLPLCHKTPIQDHFTTWRKCVGTATQRLRKHSLAKPTCVTVFITVWASPQCPSKKRCWRPWYLARRCSLTIRVPYVSVHEMP